MERDAAISHGASAFLKERLMGVSDEYQTVLCRVCGFFAVNNAATSGYKKCSLCGTEDSFGRCSIPYVYKLLIHLLAAPGLFLRPELLTTSEYANKILPKTERKEEEVEQELEEEDDDGEEEEEEEELDEDLGEDEDEDYEDQAEFGDDDIEPM